MLTHELPDIPAKNAKLQTNEKDDDPIVDPAKDMVICGGLSAKPNGEKEKSEQEGEEETDKPQKEKGSKKKLAAATPKASPNQTRLMYQYILP